MRGPETDARVDAGLWTAADRAAGAGRWSCGLVPVVGVALGEAG
jgi:hypothetical protein